jgi:excisionase family DNA binding protein
MAFSTPLDSGSRSAKGVILDDCVTAETAAALTGHNIQHIHRLAYDGKPEAVRVGRAWLISLESLRRYLRQARDVMSVMRARAASKGTYIRYHRLALYAATARCNRTL